MQNCGRRRRRHESPERCGDIMNVTSASNQMGSPTSGHAYAHRRRRSDLCKCRSVRREAEEEEKEEGMRRRREAQRDESERKRLDETDAERQPWEEREKRPREKKKRRRGRQNSRVGVWLGRGQGPPLASTHLERRSRCANRAGAASSDGGGALSSFRAPDARRAIVSGTCAGAGRGANKRVLRRRGFQRPLTASEHLSGQTWPGVGQFGRLRPNPARFRGSAAGTAGPGA